MQNLLSSSCWLSGDSALPPASKKVELGVADAGLHALAYARRLLLESPNYIEDGETLCVKVQLMPGDTPVEVKILCERKWSLSPLGH